MKRKLKLKSQLKSSPKLEIGDMVMVDKFKWSKKYEAKITWIGREWAQITSDRGIKTLDTSRLTFIKRP